MTAMRLLTLIAFLLASLFLAVPAATAQTTDLTPLVDALGQGGFPEREAAVNALVATGDERAPAILQALSDGNLYVRKSDQKVVLADKAGSDFELTDPADGADLGLAGKCGHREDQGQQRPARQDPHRHRHADTVEPRPRHPPLGRPKRSEERRSRPA